jgi:cytochrome c-type biogenesis protein CcmH
MADSAAAAILAHENESLSDLMAFWLVAALLSFAVVALLLRGARSLGARGNIGTAQAQVAIYKDQLAEIDADVLRGVIARDEADGQRTEVARRLLAAAQPEERVEVLSRPWQGAGAALAVPLLAVAIYAAVGKPTLPDLPQAERLAQAQVNNDLDALVYKVEKHLAQNPGDATGWEILIPSYQAMGRFGDVAEANRRLLAISGPSADRYADLAEALMFQGSGVMSPEAATAALEALTLDPKNTKARYYAGLAAAQDGRQSEAQALFDALLAEAPADAPYRRAVEVERAKLNATAANAPQLSEEQIAAGQALAPDDQQAMIRSMVDGLAAKLAADPRDLQGWLRLIRARVVLNEPDAARSAREIAKRTFAGDLAAEGQLDALAKELKLQ